MRFRVLLRHADRETSRHRRAQLGAPLDATPTCNTWHSRSPREVFAMKSLFVIAAPISFYSDRDLLLCKAGSQHRRQGRQNDLLQRGNYP